MYEIKPYYPNPRVTRKADVKIPTPIGADYKETVVDFVPEGKVWQIFKIDGNIRAKVGIQDLVVNGNGQGMWFWGGDNGSYVGYDIIPTFGPEGIMIAAGDTVTIRVTNKEDGATGVDSEISFYIAEYNAR